MMKKINGLEIPDDEEITEETMENLSDNRGEDEE